MRRPYWLLLLLACGSALLPSRASAWQRRLDGGANLFDGGTGVAIDPAGDVAVAGVMRHVGISYDFVVLKFAGQTGRRLWQRRIDGTYGGPGVEVFNVPAGITTDKTGDIIAGGGVMNVGTALDFTVVKLAGSDGAERWRTVIDGSGDNRVLNADQAVRVVVDAAGDVLAGGTIDTTAFAGYGEFTVVKLAGDTGAEQWRTFVGCTGGDFWGCGLVGDLAIDAAGDVFASGITRNAGTGEDITVVKLSGATGAILWEVVIDGTRHEYDYASGLALDAAGDVFVAAVTQNLGTNEDLTILKLTGADGNEKWRRTIDREGGNDEARVVRVTANGDVIAAGTAEASDSWLDMFAVRLAGSDGSEMWRQIIDSTDTLVDLDMTADAALDPAGDVLLAGMSRMLGNINGFMIAKLSGATGAEMWRDETPGVPGSGGPRALALDAAGNAVGVGTLLDDLAVIKRSEKLSGGRLRLKDSHGSRTLSLSSRDGGTLAVAPNTLGDPTHGVTGGAVLEILNPTTGERAAMSLPAVYWTREAWGYRYDDRFGDAGPCTRVSVRDGRGLRALCKGAAVTFSLDEPSQGVLAVSLATGTDAVRYCLRFGGTVGRDYGGPSGGVFLAKDAPAPAQCDP